MARLSVIATLLLFSAIVAVGTAIPILSKLFRQYPYGYGSAYEYGSGSELGVEPSPFLTDDDAEALQSPEAPEGNTATTVRIPTSTTLVTTLADSSSSLARDEIFKVAEPEMDSNGDYVSDYDLDGRMRS